MYCSNCGKAIPDDANFCFSCGEKVKNSQSIVVDYQKLISELSNSSNQTNETEIETVNDSIREEKPLENNEIADTSEDQAIERSTKVKRLILLISMLIISIPIVINIILYNIDMEERIRIYPVISDITYLDELGLSSAPLEEMTYDGVTAKVFGGDGLYIRTRNDKVELLDITNPKFEYLGLHVGQYTGLINNYRIKFYIAYLFSRSRISFKTVKHDSVSDDMCLSYVIEDDFTLTILIENHKIYSISYSDDH